MTTVMRKLCESQLHDHFKEDEEFWKSLEDFVENRKQMKAPLTEIAVTKLCNKLNEYSPKVCIAALDRSIINGWRGVFPESEIEYRPPTNEPDNPKELLDVLHKRYGLFKMPGFSGGDANPLDKFYSEMIEPVADGLVDDTEKEITGHLFTLYANLCTDDDLKLQIGAKFILEEYIRWIGDNSWINANAEKLFDLDGKLFKRFVKHYSVALNYRRDILTGKYIDG